MKYSWIKLPKEGRYLMKKTKQTKEGQYLMKYSYTKLSKEGRYLLK